MVSAAAFQLLTRRTLDSPLSGHVGMSVLTRQPTRTSSADRLARNVGLNVKPRRLLSVGHSYVIGANRALAHAIQRVGGGRWEVYVVAPSNFHGKDDLRPAVFSPQPGEPCPVVRVPAYLTRLVHLFYYGWPQLRHALRGPWDIVHAWEEPYILAGAELAACSPRTAHYVFRTAQSLNKWYPPPFNLFERYTLNRAAGWICSGQLVAKNLSERPRYSDRPMACIPLGVETTVFRPDAAAGESVRRTLGWIGTGSTGHWVSWPLRARKGVKGPHERSRYREVPVAGAVCWRREDGERTSGLGREVHRRPRPRLHGRDPRSGSAVRKRDGHPRGPEPNHTAVERAVWPNANRRNGVRCYGGRQ